MTSIENALKNLQRRGVSVSPSYADAGRTASMPLVRQLEPNGLASSPDDENESRHSLPYRVDFDADLDGAEIDGAKPDGPEGVVEAAIRQIDEALELVASDDQPIAESPTPETEYGWPLDDGQRMEETDEQYGNRSPYDSGVTEIFIGDTTMEFGAIVDCRALDALVANVACVDAGITSGEPLPLHVPTRTSSDQPKPPNSVPDDPVSDARIVDAPPEERPASMLAATEPFGSWSPPQRVPLPASELDSKSATATQELLPEDLMHVLAEIEQDQEDGKVGWDSPPAETPNYADLLSDEPFDELAQWDELIGSMPFDDSVDEAPTHIDDQRSDSTVVPRPSLPSSEYQHAEILQAFSAPNGREPQESRSLAPEPVAPTVISAASSVPPVLTAELLTATSIPISRQSSTPAPTAFEFEILKQLAVAEIRLRYEELAHNIMRMSTNGAAVIAVFVSAEVEEHVPQTLAHVAVVLAQQTSRPVLLVDANLKQHGLTKGFQAQGADGFADLVGPLPLDSMFHGTTVLPTSQPQVSLLPAGGRIDRDLVDAKTVVAILQGLSENFPIVLIDGGIVGDTMTEKVVGAATELFLLVRLGKTEQEAALRAKEALQQGGVTITGCIATNVSL